MGNTKAYQTFTLQCELDHQYLFFHTCVEITYNGSANWGRMHSGRKKQLDRSTGGSQGSVQVRKDLGKGRGEHEGRRIIKTSYLYQNFYSGKKKECWYSLLPHGSYFHYLLFFYENPNFRCPVSLQGTCPILGLENKVTNLIVQLHDVLN